jgi:DNA mismatch repair protein MutS
MKTLHRRIASRPRVPLNITPVSLMWPHGRPSTHAAPSQWESDLGLADLVRALSSDDRYSAYIRDALVALTNDPEVIAWRQAVMADFVANPALAEHVSALLPRLASLRRGGSLFGGRKRNLLLETSDRVSELEMYTALVTALHAVLSDVNITSPALTTLCDDMGKLLADENFQKLCDELPELRAPLENIRSLTIGINLDDQLQPISAALLAVNSTPITEARSLLDRLLGSGANEDDESALTPLHHTPANPDERQLSPLFRDLDKLMTQVAQPVARALTAYVKVNTAALSSLEEELAFFVSAARLMEKLKARGIPFCRPEIAPPDANVTRLDDLINIHLALRSSEAPVPNDARFDDDGRIALLTGPNSGGKTTYLQAVGLAQVLFQAGLYVPARAAVMTPVDGIFTHFPVSETRQQGRLAEEAARLRTIFAHVTKRSLVLLNETFSSTSSGEALYLAQDMLCGLRSAGARAIFATHLVELVAHMDEIEAAVPGESRLYSLVAGVEKREDGSFAPTHRITRGAPLGRSYAQEIARQYGISLDQILAELRRRGE